MKRLDIIGDIHGPFGALRNLGRALGYDVSANWSHPDSRKLVFIGDLVDRGAASLEVAQLVQGLCERGDALCLMGNHELNLVEWRHGRTGPKHSNKTTIADIERRPDAWTPILDFFESLPLALELDDHRVTSVQNSGRLQGGRGHRFWTSAFEPHDQDRDEGHVRGEAHLVRVVIFASSMAFWTAWVGSRCSRSASSETRISASWPGCLDSLKRPSLRQRRDLGLDPHPGRERHPHRVSHVKGPAHERVDVGPRHSLDPEAAGLDECPRVRSLPNPGRCLR
ncbi:MAG: metallophosphoesterase [Myxococcota bacterium]